MVRTHVKQSFLNQKRKKIASPFLGTPIQSITNSFYLYATVLHVKQLCVFKKMISASEIIGTQMLKKVVRHLVWPKRGYC